MARDALPAAAADKFHAPILPDFSAAAPQYHADLAGAFDVRAATGLQIRGFDFNGAEDAAALDFFSHAELRQLIRGSIPNVDRAILEDNLICRAFCAFQNLVSRFGAAQVNRANFSS